jgi:hypothetical protein
VGQNLASPDVKSGVCEMANLQNTDGSPWIVMVLPTTQTSRLLRKHTTQ